MFVNAHIWEIKSLKGLLIWFDVVIWTALGVRGWQGLLSQTDADDNVSEMVFVLLKSSFYDLVFGRTFFGAAPVLALCLALSFWDFFGF